MSLASRLIEIINKTATGNATRRLVAAPIGALIFFSLLVLFMLAGLWVDRLLNTPALSGNWKIIAATILLLPGTGIAGWAAIRFFSVRGTPVPLNPPPKLITTGLYAHVRNPMALGGLLILEGVGFWLGSLAVIVVFAPLPVLLYALFIKTVEEPELELRFGQEYVDYKKRVPRFFPKFSFSKRKNG